MATLLPFVLVFVVDGLRGLRECWPAALAAGVAFGAMQFATANYVSIPIADIFAVIASAGAVVLVIRLGISGARPSRPASVDGASSIRQQADARETLRACAPYI